MILFGFEGVSLLYGIKLSMAVKNVPDKVNESKYITSGKTFP